MINDFESIFSEARRMTQKAMGPKELEIVESSALTWKTISGTKTTSRKFTPYTQKKLEEWNTTDFVRYFKKLFLEKTGAEFDASVPAGALGMQRMRDCFTKLLGRQPSPSEVKQYLEWFTDNQLMLVISKFNCFKTSFLYFEPAVTKFIEQVLNARRPQREIGIDSNAADTNIFTSSMMYSVCKADKENFVKRYGLVLSTIWLIKKEHLTESDAVKEVSDIAAKLADRGEFEAIMKSTLRNNPYPLWCNFHSLEPMLVDLTNRTGEFFNLLSPRFMEDCRNFTFLADTGV